MLLTDTDLLKILCTGPKILDPITQLGIFPFDDDSLTPIGYDVRIGTKVVSEGKLQILNIGDKIKLKPKTPILVSTLERITMPENKKISGIVASKVSHSVKGISHDLTTIDPDWKGSLILSLINNASKDRILRVGDTICTLVFFENKSSSTISSFKQEDRNDLFLKEWEEYTIQIKRWKRISNYIPPLIILVSIYIGYILFENNPGFTAVVAGGVALAQLIKIYLD